MHIELSGIPLLDWDPPPLTSKLSAQHVMTTPVAVFREKETVGRILDILKNTKHHGFPVTEGYDLDTQNPENFGVLKGLILRHQLLTLLKKKTYLNDNVNLTPQDFRESYPRYIDVSNIHVKDSEREFELDLRPYMNLSPYSVTENSNLPRIFRLFRGLGLRHLTIVDQTNRVVGIVTRIDIARFKTHIGFKQSVVKVRNITSN